MNKDFVSLKQDVRKKEKEALEEKRLARENELRKKQGLKLLQKGEVPTDNTKSKDAELFETGYILADYIMLTIG